MTLQIPVAVTVNQRALKGSPSSAENYHQESQGRAKNKTQGSGILHPVPNRKRG